MNGWRRAAAGLILFGIAFGYLEASVVVYLRTVYDPVRQALHPERAVGDLFPLMPVQDLRRAAPDKSWLLGVEVGREAATILMLAAAAYAAGTRWLPAFAIAFGTWDLFFYLFLRMLLKWPASVMTWDLLFLIPVPWVAPVLAPSIVSVTIIGAGLIALRRPVHMRAVDWILMTAGGALIMLSFMWDYQNLLAGGRPRPFLWSLFGAGEVAGVMAFLRAMRRSK